MKSQVSMLSRLNPAAHALEAIDLGQRAGRGETPWSRTNPEAPLDAGRDRVPAGRRALRRTVVVVAGIALVSGLVAVGWIA